ncbi:MAG: ROK family protein [Planctomycetota bacterium]
MKILVVDVGGTNVKLLATGQAERRKFPSGRGMTPDAMVEGVKAATADWDYEVVTIGIPTPVRRGHAVLDPRNLGPGWKGYNFLLAFGKPTKLINDAAMQALGSYEGGCMLFLGLGTGLGSALVDEGHVVPLELAHLPFREATFEEYLGERGLDRFGRRRWKDFAFEAIELLRLATVAEYVVIGGGNVKKLGPLPPLARMGGNQNAFVGGFRLWETGYKVGDAATGR